MKYYKGDKTEVFALEDLENPEDWLSVPVTEISEEEALALVEIASSADDLSIIPEA